MEENLKQLETITMEDNFWNNSKKSSEILGKIKSTKNKITLYNKIKDEIKELKEYTELVELENDKNSIEEIRKV